MNRRDILTMLGGTLVLGGALGVKVEAAPTVRRIGILATAASLTQADAELELAPLRALGWVVGQNLLIERRNAPPPQDSSSFDPWRRSSFGSR